MRRALAAALLVAFAAACKPPELVSYTSIWRDFDVSAPWGWQILTDSEDAGFAQTTFIGPFDGDFFLGAPSLSVRWYRASRPHRLRDGRLEVYADPRDFYKQMMAEVYGPKSFVTGVELPDGTHADGPSEITLKGSGLKATYFTVLSPTPAPAGNQWGISVGKDGKPAVLRRHSYALVPVEGGFYVLCYPATQAGYDRHEAKFRALLGSFAPRTAGPGGPAVRIAPR